MTSYEEPEVIKPRGSQGNVDWIENMLSYGDRIVSADDRAPLGARPSAVTVMTKVRLRHTRTWRAKATDRSY